ncbi:hypothetical protein ABIC08_007732 [Bradyrhizobium sp. RT9b]|uniref:hypothetical protein n=1 Tax=unclassified Bradyrhizobium TaxID=2631580 RepID=UPI003398A0B0
MSVMYVAVKQTPPLGAVKDEFMRGQQLRYSHQVELKMRDISRNLKDEDKIEAAKKARHQEAIEEMREFNRKQDQRRIEAYVKSANDPCIGQLARRSRGRWTIIRRSACSASAAHSPSAICCGGLRTISSGSTRTTRLRFWLSRTQIIRFIWQRCIINGVKLPARWPVGSRAFDPARVHDTLAFGSGPVRGGDIEALAAALKLPAFEPIELMLALQQGNWGPIAIDAQNDVRRLRAVNHRLRGRAVLDADLIGLGGKVVGKPDLAVVAGNQSAMA